MKPRVLLLDVMDTLVRDPFRATLPSFFGLSFEELVAHKDPTAWTDFEKGLIEEDEYHRRAFRDRRGYDGAELLRRMVEGYAWLPGMRELVEELARGGVEMHALSNYPSWYRMLDEKLAVSRHVPWTFVSCKTGHRKPHPRAYLGAAEALGRAPPECLFVDDRAHNCVAAREVGMQAHEFRDAEALRGALVELELL